MTTPSVSSEFVSSRIVLGDVEAQVAYLKLQDDPLRWEAPRMFNRCAELRRFERFVDALQAKLDRKLDYALGSGVDDAPFHGEVFVTGASVRASNFGRMLTVLFCERLSQRALSALWQVAEEHGYVMIPEALLSQPYCASHAETPSNETWGSRFFGCENRKQLWKAGRALGASPA